MSVQQIADLAWAGQHEKAISAATAALRRKTQLVEALNNVAVRDVG